MTIEDVVKIFNDKVPYRRPVKYARQGDTWYLYTENTANGGRHLPVIENGWYSVTDEKVLPVTPLDMPVNIQMIAIPIKYRTIGTK